MSLDIPSEWEWTQDVADNFGDHVREQLPWYDMATAAVAQIGRHYIPEGGDVLDLGCATGNISRALLPIVKLRMASIEGVDSSAAMTAIYAATVDDRFATVDCEDVRRYIPTGHDFAVSFLTLMFLPPRDVEPTVRRLVDATNPGGAVVLVERTTPTSGYPSLVMSRLILNAKREAGATPADIITKELALAGVQRPIPTTLLADLGAVEWFRFADFGGYLIEKP